METPQLVVLNLILLLLVLVANMKAQALSVPGKPVVVGFDRTEGCCGRGLASSAQGYDK